MSAARSLILIVILGMFASLLLGGGDVKRPSKPNAGEPQAPLPTRPVQANAACPDCPRLYVHVGVISMSGVPWQIEDNYHRLDSYVREAVRRRAELVIAPEGLLDGYVCAADPEATRERMVTVAQTIPDGPYLKRAAKLCQELGIHLVFGFLEKSGDNLFNTCALFNPEGKIIAKYSKIHPTAESFITPGKELKPFDTPFGKMGFLICSDRGLVDNFSTLGAQGTEILVIPMDGGGGADNTAMLRQRARDNYCSIIVANTWSSVIMDHRGESTLEKYESECVSVGKLFLYDIPKGSKRGRFLERRPDLYGPLTKPGPADSHFDEQGRPTSRELKTREDWRKQMRTYPKK